jgi:hypothetical protein
VAFGSIGSAGAGAPVRALSFSDNGDAEGSVVFAGYGIVVPDEPGLRLRQLRDAGREGQDRRRPALLPEDAEPKTKDPLPLRRPPLQGDGGAASGAKAIVVVTGPTSPNAGELAPMTFDAASPAPASSPSA